MEPLLVAALALGTVVGTKALEKTGEKIGETLWDKAQQCLANLKQESPDTVRAIVEHTPNQPLNCDQITKIAKEIQAAAEKRPELRAQIEELAALGLQEPKLMPYIKEIEAYLRSNPSVVNNSKIAENIGAKNIGNVIQGGNNNIHQTFS